MLPTFFVIGAQKSGTSSLYRYLRQHPQVFMPELKEPDYFVEERSWGRGLDWYESLFEPAGDAVSIGEASTSYAMYPTYRGVPARIAALIPEARFVYLVRHPIERMRSEYLHYRNLRDDAVQRFRIERERSPIETALRSHPHYLNHSRYALQLDQYLSHFERERIIVITTEELKRNRATTVGRVFDFLGVDPSWIPSEMDLEFNRTNDARVPRGVLRTVRGIPGSHTLARAIPRSMKVAAKQRMLTTRVNVDEARLSDDLRNDLEQLLRDDVRLLRPYLPTGFDGWGIA
jgi:Sulfotransferase domain